MALDQKRRLLDCVPGGMASSPGSSQGSWGAWSPDPSQLITIDMTRSQMLGLGISPPPTNYNPRMVLKYQPESRFRYRYDTEMSGTHGSLQAERRDSREKGVPTVELQGFSGPAVIRVSVATCNDGNERYPHPHHLFVKEKLYLKKYVNLDGRKVYKTGHYMDPHYIILKEDRTARFEGMCIINSKKEQFGLVIREKLVIRGVQEGPELDKLVDEALRHVDIAFVCLCFEAFRYVDGVIGQPLCPPIYSNAIANAKNASTGKLKITKINKCSGSCKGGDSIWLLVEKINKKGLVVRFFEQAANGSIVWEADVEGDKLELHHQYAVIFNTPPYRDQDITRDVTVSMRLERRTVPFDFSESETFVYVPSTTKQSRNETLYHKESMFLSGCNNKRPMTDLIQPYELPSKRKADDLFFGESLPQLPSEFNNREIELIIQQLTQDLPARKGDSNCDFFDITREDFFQPLFTDCYVETDGPQDNPKRTVALMRLLVQILVTRSQLKDRDLRNVTERISRLFLKPDDFRLQDAASTLLSLRSNAMNKKPAQEAVISMDQATEVPLSKTVKLEMKNSTDDRSSDLEAALERGDIDRLQSVLKQNDNNVRLNERNEQGGLPLHVAIIKKNVVAVKCLLSAGADVNLEDRASGKTSLHLAVATGDADIVQSVLAHPTVNLSRRDNNGNTAAQLCASLHPSLAHLFVKKEKQPPPKCLEKVAEILNRTEKWRNLAELMDAVCFIEETEKSSNPTMCLFNAIERKNGLELDMIRNMLDILEERECVAIVDETLAKTYL